MSDPKARVLAELAEQLREIRQDANDIIRDAAYATHIARTILLAAEPGIKAHTRLTRLAQAAGSLPQLRERTSNLDRLAGNIAAPVSEASKLNIDLAGDFTS